jgi:hypothetical protein
VLFILQGRYVHEATKRIPIIGDGDTGCAAAAAAGTAAAMNAGTAAVEGPAMPGLRLRQRVQLLSALLIEPALQPAFWIDASMMPSQG